MDSVYGAVIMTQVIARVHPFHLTNAPDTTTNHATSLCSCLLFLLRVIFALSYFIVIVVL